LKILVVGGAGYIGSHMVKHLYQLGCQVVTLDNLSSGHREAVIAGEFINGDIANSILIDNIFTNHKIDAVMHFASFIQVGESVLDPLKYYLNNVSGTLNLLNSMIIAGISRFIFSSTAAIFGVPVYVPIDESHSKKPINPYGKTKLIIEDALVDFELAYGLKSICLRYFNAAGADPAGLLGERHDPETHLIPLVLQVASGRRPHISVFGRDYETPDGTCIRDYIHVSDLCEAHWLALQMLLKGGGSNFYNLGNSKGFSVQEVIDTARRITGKPIPIVYATKRVGDPARLIADSSFARTNLGWAPKYASLETIIEHAWQWEQRTFDDKKYT
jgi:UDP-glucose 4-epimerase